jgi:uncharacterized membrane protein
MTWRRYHECRYGVSFHDPHPDCGPLINRLTFTLFLLAGLILVFGIYIREEKAIDRANEQRQAAMALADELRQSLDDLTRMVRTYAMTGDPIYKRNYQNILDIRDGKRPRPEHYQNVYWDLVVAGRLPPPPAKGPAIALLELMRQAGFGDASFRQLAEAKLHSDHLTASEFAAMQLAETVGPDREAALARGLTACGACSVSWARYDRGHVQSQMVKFPTRR